MAVPYEDDLRNDLLNFAKEAVRAQAKKKVDESNGVGLGRFLLGGSITDESRIHFTFMTHDGHKFRVSADYLGAFQSVFVPVGHFVSVSNPKIVGEVEQ